MSREDLERQIDQVCDEYERELRGGARPNPVPYVKRADASVRSRLVRELLELEAEWMGANETASRWNRCIEELSEYADVIHGCLEAKDLSTIALQPPDNLPPESGQPSKPTKALPREKVGNYKLQRVIDEGGMGTVFLAEQQHPVRRRVALKIIKSGLGSKEIIARFEAERQALAIMDHPNIARILDAGTTDEGQPFFVMEYVKGHPLTRYCDQRRMALSGRLKLFSEVCEAVQHAHQKGIIHRDLKPSNILVGDYEGRPVAKVIDFGLAKAIEPTHKLTDKTVFTEFGQVVGTLKYMSPEQAGLEALDIDTRADIYSLGVILYELLTGSTPLSDESIRGQAVLKVLEQLREQESPRPSSRLSTTNQEQLSSITQRRSTDGKHLRQILTGDLDWIVMKAIDKDRNRRFSSAASLAEDIRRYLSNEPVTARPPSLAYRVQKYIRKHRAGVVAAGLLLVALCAGIIGTTWGMVWALEAEETAQKRLKEAKSARSASEELVVAKTHLIGEKEELIEELKKAVDAEQTATNEAKEEQRLAALNYYVSQIALAASEYENNYIDSAKGLLFNTDPRFRSWEWERLRWLLSAGYESVSTRSGSVIALDCSPDGRWVAALCSSGRLLILDASTRKVARTISNLRATRNPSGGDFWIHKIEFTPDSQRILAIQANGDVGIFDVNTAQVLDRIPCNGEFLLTFDLSADGETVCWSAHNPDHRAKEYDSNAYVLRRAPETGGTSWIQTKAFKTNGSAVWISLDASGSRAILGTECWDLETSQPLWSLNSTYTKGDFVDEGKHAVFGNWNGYASILDAQQGTELRVLQHPRDQARMTHTTVSRGGKYLLTGDQIWRMPKGFRDRRLLGATQSFSAAAFSANQDYLVTNGSSGKILFWKFQDEPETHTHLGFDTGSGYPSAALSRHGDWGVLAAADRTDAGDLVTGRRFQTTQHSSEIATIAVSPSDDHYLVGTKLGSLDRVSFGGPHLLEQEAESVLLTAPTFSTQHEGPFICLRFNASGEKVAVCETHLLKILTAKDHRQLQSFEFPEGIVDATWIGESDRLGLALESGKVLSLDLSTGERNTIHEDIPKVRRIDFSEDGSSLVVSSAHRALIIDLDDPASSRYLHGAHAWGTLDVRFLRGSKRVVTIGIEGEIRLWDAETGLLVSRLADHVLSIGASAFSHDRDRMLIVCGQLTRLWQSNYRAAADALKFDEAYTNAQTSAAEGQFSLAIDLMESIPATLRDDLQSSFLTGLYVRVKRWELARETAVNTYTPQGLWQQTFLAAYLNDAEWFAELRDRCLTETELQSSESNTEHFLRSTALGPIPDAMREPADRLLETHLRSNRFDTDLGKVVAGMAAFRLGRFDDLYAAHLEGTGAAGWPQITLLRKLQDFQDSPDRQTALRLARLVETQALSLTNNPEFQGDVLPEYWWSLTSLAVLLREAAQTLADAGYGEPAEMIASVFAAPEIGPSLGQPARPANTDPTPGSKMVWQTDAAWSVMDQASLTPQRWEKAALALTQNKLDEAIERIREIPRPLRSESHQKSLCDTLCRRKRWHEAKQEWKDWKGEVGPFSLPRQMELAAFLDATQWLTELQSQGAGMLSSEQDPVALLHLLHGYGVATEFNEELREQVSQALNRWITNSKEPTDGDLERFMWCAYRAGRFDEFWKEICEGKALQGWPTIRLLHARRELELQPNKAAAENLANLMSDLTPSIRKQFELDSYDWWPNPIRPICLFRECLRELRASEYWEGCRELLPAEIDSLVAPSKGPSESTPVEEQTLDAA